jgi:hypothetical protein
LFSSILNNGRKDVARFEKQLKNLFKAMSERHGEFGEHFIQWMLQHGFAPSREPILKTLDQIQCRDALLGSSTPSLPGGGVA